MCYPSQAPLLLVVMCSVDRLVLTPDDARLVLLQLFSRHPPTQSCRSDTVTPPPLLDANTDPYIPVRDNTIREKYSNI